jgi:myo-inositol catabolism protein IolC
MSIPNDSWLPLPEEPLFVLAMDHRGSSAKALPGSPSGQPHIGLSRMRQVKALVYEGLCHIAGSIPVGREGVLADGASGADVLRRAKSDGLVVLMPIEAPGSRVFELEHHDRFAEHIEAFDPDFLNALVRYNPLDDEGMRHTTITRLAAVSEWAARANRRWIIELLVPPTPGQQATHQNRHDFESAARSALTAQAISQLQSGGIHPAAWMLEGFERPDGADEVLAVVAAEREHPAQCIVSGRDAPIDQVAEWLTLAAGRRFVGFAVGRAIWEESAQRLLAGTLSSEGVIDAVAEAYGTLVDAFMRGSERSRAGPH